MEPGSLAQSGTVKAVYRVCSSSLGGMSADDHRLLREISAALNLDPFAASIRVFGIALSRQTARAIERQMLRLRFAERLTA